MKLRMCTIELTKNTQLKIFEGDTSEKLSKHVKINVEEVFRIDFLPKKNLPIPFTHDQIILFAILQGLYEETLIDRPTKLTSHTKAGAILPHIMRHPFITATTRKAFVSCSPSFEASISRATFALIIIMVACVVDRALLSTWRLPWSDDCSIDPKLKEELEVDQTNHHLHTPARFPLLAPQTTIDQ